MPNPLEAYNKRVKKREKEKRKKARLEVRTSKKLLEDPEKLKKELDELTHKAIIGRIDAESLERKEKIEKLWDQYTKNRQAKDREASESPSEKSEESSSSDSEDSSDSDEEPKCVIEIEGETKKEQVKRRKGFHDAEPPDDFQMELMNNIPKLEEKEEKVAVTKPKEESKKFSYTPRPRGNAMPASVPYTLNPPPPPPPLPVYQVPPNYMKFPPQPPPMRNLGPNLHAPQHRNANVEKPQEEKVAEAVPLSRYFVPSQVRLNRKNPDHQSKK